MSTDNTNTIAGTDSKDKITIKNEGTTNEPTKLSIDSGNMLFTGQNRDDSMVSGTGNEVMIGCAGSDTYSFADGNGQDAILDFEVGIDKVILSSVTTVNSFADVQSASTESNGFLTIDFSNSNQLKLDGIVLSNLSDSDFIF